MQENKLKDGYINHKIFCFINKRSLSAINQPVEERFFSNEDVINYVLSDKYMVGFDKEVKRVWRNVKARQRKRELPLFVYEEGNYYIDC